MLFVGNENATARRDGKATRTLGEITPVAPPSMREVQQHSKKWGSPCGEPPSPRSVLRATSLAIARHEVLSTTRLKALLHLFRSSGSICV